MKARWLGTLVWSLLVAAVIFTPMGTADNSLSLEAEASLHVSSDGARLHSEAGANWSIDASPVVSGSGSTHVSEDCEIDPEAIEASTSCV